MKWRSQQQSFSYLVTSTQVLTLDNTVFTYTLIFQETVRSDVNVVRNFQSIDVVPSGAVSKEGVSQVPQQGIYTEGDFEEQSLSGNKSSESLTHDCSDHEAQDKTVTTRVGTSHKHQNWYNTDVCMDVYGMTWAWAW